MDSAVYHNRQIDKLPTKSSIQYETLGWLARHGGMFPSSTRKAILFETIKQIKPQDTNY